MNVAIFAAASMAIESSRIQLVKIPTTTIEIELYTRLYVVHLAELCETMDRDTRAQWPPQAREDPVRVPQQTVVARVVPIVCQTLSRSIS